MKEFAVTIMVNYGPGPPAILVRANSKEHAVLVAGHALGSKVALENVTSIEVKWMR